MSLRDLLGGLPRILRPPTRRGATAPLPPHQLPTVPAVVAVLRDIGAGLEQGDGLGQFNRMYLQVTEEVAARLGEGYFTNEAFMERLDIVFAHLYLDTVRAEAQGRALPQCWQPVFDNRAVPLAPIQFALAGMNAHINHDLPVAVVATCRQLGLHPGSRGVRIDYDKITHLLAEVHEQVRQSFLDGVALAVDRELTPLLTLVGSWSVGRAREAAWINSEVMWQLRRTPGLEEEFRLNLCRSVGMAGRALLVPVAEPV